MARWVVLGAALLVAIVVSCSDDEMPPYAEDLGRDGTIPPGRTDTTPDDGGVPADGALGDGGVITCAPVSVGDAVNDLAFDDASLGFAPQSAHARFRADCVAPGRMQVVLSESASCGAGEREVIVDLPSTAATGQTLLLTGDDIAVSFEDSDGTRFSNVGDCATSSGSVRLEAYDPDLAGAVQQLVLEVAQLFDCSVGARAPITVSGTLAAPLEATFGDACTDG